MFVEMGTAEEREAWQSLTVPIRYHDRVTTFERNDD